MYDIVIYYPKVVPFSCIGIQTKLLDQFPIEAGRIDPEKRIIPCLPGK